MINQTLEDVERNVDAKKLVLAIVHILVFKGHISRSEGDKIIQESISGINKQ